MLFFFIGSFAAQTAAHAKARRPNILLILADDLGYGDVGCFNRHSKIPTPHLDRLAREGLRCLDAHSPSSVCTPTRYGLLTGRYAWRTRLEKGVLLGFSPPLLAPGQPTLASTLASQGYRTAMIGKWHLGLSWPARDPGTQFLDQSESAATGWKVDYRKPFEGGPLAAGFHTFFGISASLDMPPYVDLIDHRVSEIPSVDKTWIRKGPAASSFEAEEVLPRQERKAVEFIDSQAGAAVSRAPFFLYLALTSPHTPILPTPEWKGRSGLNPYADFVLQTDATIGRLMEALRRNGMEDETLVIFTADNGCSPAAGWAKLRSTGHSPSGPFRGHKADLFEGGHRVPFVARWPGRVKAGSSSKRALCLTDLSATFRDLVGGQWDHASTLDSFSFADLLGGKREGPKRGHLIHHSIDGSFGVREGRWKLLLCGGSGGWSEPKPGSDSEKQLPRKQLYDLESDPGESRNRIADYPEMANALERQLQRWVQNGRSTPGPAAANDRTVKWIR
ncbi:MAG: arylsulfatase [Verrucomicrobia bacterium]|nr:arylsulfatase [Verrucomicrobiota bacterium]